MPRYEVVLHFRGFLVRGIEAEDNESAILAARSELNAPCNRAIYRMRFEPILETLSPWHERDTAKEKG